MFLTQLNGLQQRIFDKEEYPIEDTARLLAQAAVGEGTIYIKGYKEMESVSLEAFEGAEPLQLAKPFHNIDELTDADRVLIISRFSNDLDALHLAKKLVKKGIPFSSISGKVNGQGEDISELADVHINTTLLKSMLPTETGDRAGFPSALIGLFIYHCIKFQFDEIIAEYNEEI
jgi:hypothetical protein